MRLGIRAQLISYTLATALLVGGATMGYSIYKQRNAIHQELQTRAMTMASSLANALVDPFYEADINRLSLQLELAQRDQDVVIARARDEFGREIASATDKRDRSSAEPEFDLQRLRASNWKAVLPGSEPDSFTAVSPVRVAGGEPLGFVCLTFTEARALERIRTETWEQLKLLLALFVVGIVMAVILSRRLVNPIKAMVAGTTAIRDGRFDVRIAAGGRDELGELADSINVMAQKLEHGRRELELRVEQRTEELAEANRNLEGKIIDGLRAEDTLRTAKKSADANARRAEGAMADMERMNAVMMSREERVMEMKQEVNALLAELGQARKYEHV